MIKSQYIMYDDEINMLVERIRSVGEERLFESIFDNASLSMHRAKDVDEILMDQYETILERSRIIKNNNGNEHLYKDLCKIACILRIIAHKIHNMYIRAGKKVNNERFLHIIK